MALLLIVAAMFLFASLFAWPESRQSEVQSEDHAPGIWHGAWFRFLFIYIINICLQLVFYEEGNRIIRDNPIIYNKSPDHLPGIMAAIYAAVGLAFLLVRGRALSFRAAAHLTRIGAMTTFVVFLMGFAKGCA